MTDDQNPTPASAEISASESVPVCSPPCASGSYCMNTSNGPRCIPASAPPGTAPEFWLPFDASVEVACTHSSGLGSHSWPNAYFALDLATAYETEAPVIRAAAEGTAFVFLGEDGKPCPQPPGTARSAESSRCGEGWGNSVKVYHGNDIASFYVHFERVHVANGQHVTRGQPLGIMGWTGAAGHRHLHWSVQRIPQWPQHTEWSGDSIPFRFRANVNGEEHLVDAATLRCKHVGFGMAPPSEQPHLRGLGTL